MSPPHQVCWLFNRDSREHLPPWSMVLTGRGICASHGGNEVNRARRSEHNGEMGEQTAGPSTIRRALGVCAVGTCPGARVRGSAITWVMGKQEGHQWLQGGDVDLTLEDARCH